jgi:DNA-binding Lrp family transcriptional regulator
VTDLPTKAFILIEAEVGRVQQASDALRSLPGITSADVITGSYDIIALVEAADMATMAELVTGQIQGITGVLRTITCVAAG